MKNYLRKAFLIIEAIFALVGLFFVLVFVGMKFDLLNVRGTIEKRNQFFIDSLNSLTNQTTSTASVYEPLCNEVTQKVCLWNETREWALIKAGLIKDAPIINSVADITKVPSRMITSAVISEQLRYFTSNREVFKRYFEPLKILVSLTQFSLGVSGIKEETAKQIEQYANNPQSYFYPGAGVSGLISYSTSTTANHDTELYNRLADEKSHYYSYLYTAIYIKEIEAQWQKAGFNISKNPEAISTLFNIGFNSSKPKANPVAAGSVITLGGVQYSFGQLGGLFYNSDELVDVFQK